MSRIVIHKSSSGRGSKERYCETCGEKLSLWGHDLDAPPSKRKGICEDAACPMHGQPVNWRLLSADGTPHGCPTKFRYRGSNGSKPDSPSPAGNTADGGDDAPDDDDVNGTVPPVTAPVVPVVSQPSPLQLNGDAQAAAALQLQQALALLMPQQNVNAEQVKALIAQMVPDMINSAVTAAVGHLKPVTRIEVHDRKADVVRTVDGPVSTVLPRVIGYASHGANVLMVGPMGTGKSHMARQVGKALDLTVREISLTPQTGEHRLFGFMGPAGYVRTAFRDWWEFGGVFHFDELDNGNPSIMAGVNAAMALCTEDDAELEFPDGRIPKAKVTIGVASANTYGKGPDRQYQRQQLDAATVDRFETVRVPYDREIERFACLSTGLDENVVDEVLVYVRHLRAAAEDGKLPLALGLRRSRGTCLGLALDVPWAEAVEISLRRDISDSDWAKVTRGAKLPAVSWS